MALILTLDTMGGRYGMLPSEILERGNTLDLYIMDVAITYQNNAARRQNGEPPQVEPEKLKELAQRAHEQRKQILGSSNG